MEFKGTKGEWKLDGLTAQHGRYAACELDINFSEERESGITIWCRDEKPTIEELANAQLIADAGTTISKCDLLPSELLEQRNELLQALKLMKLCSNYDEAKKLHGNSDKHWTSKIDEVINKVLGV